MSTMKKLKNAKDRLAQAEQEVPGAYESGYTGRVNDRLDKIGGLNDTGVTDAALSEAYQSYRDKVAGNAADSAAAALGTTQSLGSGYGTDWAKSVADQTAADQTASAGTALAELRSKALQQWQNELAGNADMVSTLLGQDSMERSAAAQDTANAQTWRNYLYGRLGQARQESEDAKNNLWNIIKGIGSVAKAGYDGYMGYTQQQWENDFKEKQYADSLSRAQLSDQLAAMEQATAFKQAGFDELANQTLAKYGLDSTMLDAWQGMSDTTKEQMAALLQGASLASSGNDTGAKSYLQLAGIDTGSMDYSDTLKQKDIDWQVQLQKALNGVNLQYQQQQYQMKKQYGSSGSSGRRSGSGSSGSKTGSSGFTNSQLMSMSKAFKGMASTDPMYSFYKKTLTDAGWLTDSEPGTGITTKRMQVAANAAQGQQSRGSDEQTIYNSLRLQGYSEDEIAYAMGTLK
nr:MAG TPA_asm: hypothetical protein [Caudoviricetes sp.]